MVAGFLVFFLLFAGYFMLRPVRETMGLAGGVDNLQWLFTGTFLVTLVSFGALVAFSAVNLSVIKHYFFDQNDRNVFNNLVLPLIGFGLTVWLWTSLEGEAFRMGLIWLALGFVWLLVVTRGFQRPTPVLEMKE